MENKTLSLLWAEALTSDDCDRYVAEWSTSSIWGNMEDLTDDDLLTAAVKLTQIWELAHMTVKEICKKANLSQSALADRFCIPRRTVEDWCRGLRTPPDYIRFMMALLLELLNT